jgi:hypothetical protein
MSFPQRQVKVKSTINEHAYNILNFKPMFHIHLYSMLHTNTWDTNVAPSEVSSVPLNDRDFKRFLVSCNPEDDQRASRTVLIGKMDCVGVNWMHGF